MALVIDKDGLVVLPFLRIRLCYEQVGIFEKQLAYNGFRKGFGALVSFLKYASHVILDNILPT